MKRLLIPAALCGLVLVACSQDSTDEAVSTDSGAGVDQVFVNGVVYTVDEDRTWAQAFAVSDGKFVAVGNNEDIEAMAGDDTQVVDLGGRFTLPGFIDTHFHSVAASIITAEFDTGDLPTNEAMYARLREFAATQEGRTEPLITYGWHLANFPAEGPRKGRPR